MYGNEGTSGKGATNAAKDDDDGQSLRKIKEEQDRIMREIEQQNQGNGTAYRPPAPTQNPDMKTADAAKGANIETSVSMDYNPEDDE